MYGWLLQKRWNLCRFWGKRTLQVTNYSLIVPAKHKKSQHILAPIDHFTVVCLVAWPSNDSEAEGDLCFEKKKTLTFSNVNYAVLSIQNNVPPASLSSKGQATKQTTVKMVYYIFARSIQVIFPVFCLILMFSKQVLVWLYSFDCFFKMEKSVCNYISWSV